MIVIEGLEPHFQYEYLYLRMQSTYGCKLRIKVCFPKEDLKERKRENDIANGIDESITNGKQKTKNMIEIE